MTQQFEPVAGGEYLSDDERGALAAAGFGGRGPRMLRDTALVVVDVTYGFCGKPTHGSLAESVAEYPHACGPTAWRAVPAIRTLVDGARRHGVPIIFTRPTPPALRPNWRGRLEDKNDRRAEAPADTFEMVPESGYVSGDILLDKDCPSAFFGTPLVRWLHGLGVGGVVVCGGSTSGCVRATGVDAFSYDLRATLVADACFDRIQASHRVTLLDFELKYGDVASAGEVVRGWAEVASRPPA